MKISLVEGFLGRVDNTKLLRLLLFVSFISIFFFCSNLAKADTSVSGNVTSDTTWSSANSPYIITDDVQVLNGATLTIQPGVTVKFYPSKSLKIGGSLIARGTENNKITFTSNQSSPQARDWDGIYFLDGSTDASLDSNSNYLSGSEVEYAIIEYSRTFQILSSSPYISHNTFRHNGDLSTVVLDKSSSVFKSNTLDSNLDTTMYVSYSNAKIIGNTIKNGTKAFDIHTLDTSLIAYNQIQDNYSGFYLDFSSNPTIKYNNIINSGSDGRAFWMAQNSDVTAKYNYWGTTNSSEIDLMIHDYYDNISLGKIIYSPFALEEININNIIEDGSGNESNNVINTILNSDEVPDVHYSNQTILNYSKKKNTAKKVNITLDNISLLKKKKYTKVYIGKKKTQIKNISVNGSNSIVKVNLQYGKLARGNYLLRVIYKTKQGKKLLKRTYTQENYLVIQ